MSTVAIEWAPFRLAEGVSEDQILAASEAVQRDFLRERPGFLRRELLSRENGEWVDLIYWQDAETARRAMDEAASSPVCLEYFQLMSGLDQENPENSVAHFALRRSYSRN